MRTENACSMLARALQTHKSLIAVGDLDGCNGKRTETLLQPAVAFLHALWLKVVLISRLNRLSSYRTNRGIKKAT